MAMDIDVNDVPICSGSMSHTYNPRTAGTTFFGLLVAQERSAQFRSSIPPPKNFQRRPGAHWEHSRMLQNAVCIPPPTHIARDCPVQVLITDEARIILVLILESLHREPCAHCVCAPVSACT